ncbi:DNA-binding transcriptional ArsR family regulator [Inhella inkyongensis]|uniref:DNA-binding transcriptional ArsR family regulator n=1 Tax=Inhella inkyongensis TaxID=392593 RepID=A0A840S7B1_9BURK|nr:DNA-binding transcriptional ArsR family regulator [Inhella inkyongensis]
MPKTSLPPATLDGLPDPALAEVASFFQALAEPNRLRLLNLLRGGEQRVGDLAELSGMTTTNVSRHLSLLQQRGLVLREGRGTSVYYRIADVGIYELCDLVCGSLARQSESQARARLALFRT